MPTIDVNGVCPSVPVWCIRTAFVKLLWPLVTIITSLFQQTNILLKRTNVLRVRQFHRVGLEDSDLDLYWKHQDSHWTLMTHFLDSTTSPLNCRLCGPQKQALALTVVPKSPREGYSLAEVEKDVLHKMTKWRLCVCLVSAESPSRTSSELQTATARSLTSHSTLYRSFWPISPVICLSTNSFTLESLEVGVHPGASYARVLQMLV